jgi:hypothetical protein
MTLQLRDIIEQIQTLYALQGGQKAREIFGQDAIPYNDLISQTEQEFWQYLCKKDFKRL